MLLVDNHRGGRSFSAEGARGDDSAGLAGARVSRIDVKIDVYMGARIRRFHKGKKFDSPFVRVEHKGKTFRPSIPCCPIIFPEALVCKRSRSYFHFHTAAAPLRVRRKRELKIVCTRSRRREAEVTYNASRNAPVESGAKI